MILRYWALRHDCSSGLLVVKEASGGGGGGCRVQGDFNTGQHNTG